MYHNNRKVANVREGGVSIEAWKHFARSSRGNRTCSISLDRGPRFTWSDDLSSLSIRPLCPYRFCLDGPLLFFRSPLDSFLFLCRAGALNIVYLFMPVVVCLCSVVEMAGRCFHSSYADVKHATWIMMYTIPGTLGNNRTCQKCSRLIDRRNEHLKISKMCHVTDSVYFPIQSCLVVQIYPESGQKDSCGKCVDFKNDVGFSYRVFFCRFLSSESFSEFLNSVLKQDLRVNKLEKLLSSLETSFLFPGREVNGHIYRGF